MIFGMTTATYTLVHVLISLAGIGSGFVVMYGLLTGKHLDRWNAVFLVTTVATSVTGFGFPFTHLSPGNKIGILSLGALAIAMVARYALHLAGGLAPDLRRLRRSGPLFQYVCPGCAAL
jgi:hypothetical protein